MLSSRPRLRRALRGVSGVVSALGLCAVFGAAAGGALLLHADLPAFRREGSRLLGGLLAATFQGQVSVGSVEHVSAYALRARDIVVRDAEWRVVLRLSQISAQADVLEILRRLLLGGDKVTIVVQHVRVERAEAHIIPGEDGTPTLVRALTPAASEERPTAQADERYVRVWLPEIELGRVFARGTVGGSPTLETEIENARASLLATPKGAAIDVTRFSLLARGVTGADARGIATLHVRAPGAVWSSFDGYVGDVQFGSVVRWENRKLSLTLDVPRAEPAAMRALLPEYPLLSPATARLKLEGEPEAFDVRARAEVDSALVSANGSLSFADGLKLTLGVDAQAVDLRSLLEDAPPTALHASGDVTVQSEPEGVVVAFGGSLQPTRVGELDVPAVDVSGLLREGQLEGQAWVHDLGLPLEVEFARSPSGSIAVDARARGVDLSQVARLRPYAALRGRTDLDLHAVIEAGRLDATLGVDARELRYADFGLGSARLSASARGPLSAPRLLALDAKLTGRGLNAGQFGFDALEARARGPLRGPLLSATLTHRDGARLESSARLSVDEGALLSDIELGVSREGVGVRGSVERVALESGTLRVERLRLSGASGELSGSAVVAPASLSVNASGKALNLSAFSRVLGLPRGTLEGRASLELDAHSGRGGQRGSARLTLEDASIMNVSGITADLDARLDGSRLAGSAKGEVESLAAFATEWELELDGPLGSSKSYLRSTGTARLDLDNVTLDYFGPFVRVPDLELQGNAKLGLRLSREDPEVVPDIELAGSTQNLRVSIARDGQEPIVLSGLELELGATHAAESGATSAALGVRRQSERWLSATAETSLDLAAALAGRDSLDQQLQRSPFAGKAVLAETRLDELPDPLRLPGVRGSLRLESTLHGSLSDPRLSVSLRGSGLSLAASERSRAVDVCATAEYQKQSGDFSLGSELFLASAAGTPSAPCSGKRFANLRVSGSAPWQGIDTIQSWSGMALLGLESMPLSVVPPLAEAGLSGTSSGSFTLQRRENLPSLSAKLELSEVRIENFEVGSGTLALRSNPERARADFMITRGESSLQGSLDAGLNWSSGLPEIASSQPIEARVNARSMQASLLEPLLTDVLSDLQGRVDGQLQARLEPLEPGSSERRASNIAGDLMLRDGSFQLAGLGLRLHAVSFNAHAKTDGNTTLIEVPDIAASALTSSQNLSAHARLRLAGLSLVAANARVHVEDLPLVVDGVARATAMARAQMSVERRPEKMLATIYFDRLDARLPSAPSRNLINLDKPDNVTLLQPIAEPENRRDDGQLPWHFWIHLGEQARLTRGVDLNLPISGSPNVVLADDLGVTGSVALLPGGVIEIAGKTFVIERGGVIFDQPEASNPRLDVTASWRSPEGQAVFMRVTGTLAAPEVAFDPPEATALLLGGDASALGVSALDALLGQTPLARVQLSARADNDDRTGAGDSTTYTAAVRASDTVVVEGSYRGQAAGSDPNQPGGDVSAAIEWRFRKRWSVRTEIGTIGTGIDLLYQYRY
jgi:hypothetical protein